MDSRKANTMLGQTKALPTKNTPKGNPRARSTTIAPWDEPTSDLSRIDDISPFDVDPQTRIGGTRPFNQSYFNQSPRDTPPKQFSSRQNSEEALGNDQNGRRPSVASNDTVSSAGSRGSAPNSGPNRGFQRKALNAFFGDEVPGGRKDSQIPINDATTKGRNNSVNNGLTGDDRPTTPQPASSTVTPWDYQNFDDVGKFGTAPIRQDLPAEPETNGNSKQTTASAIKGKLLPHRHTRSKDEATKNQALAPPLAPLRPTSSREPSQNTITQSWNSPDSATPMSSSSNLPKSKLGPASQPEQNGTSGKRGFFSKLKARTHLAKSDKHPQPQQTQPEPQSSFPSFPEEYQDQSRERGQSISNKKYSVASSSAISEKKDRESSVASNESASTIKAAEMPKIDRTFTATSVASKASRLGRLGHGRNRDRTMSSAQTSIPETPKKEAAQAGMWHIDTNFDDMSDIIAKSAPGEEGEGGDAKSAIPPTPSTEMSAPAWETPDSWAVKGQDAGIGTQPHDVAESGLSTIEEEDGVSYFMRIFRSDGTFATLSMLINATVAEVMQSLAKKSVLHDTIENYHLILRKNQLSRQLGPTERPIAMQRRLLSQAGYQDQDHIDEVGREDNSYLCRFTFSHEKQTGFGTSTLR